MICVTKVLVVVVLVAVYSASANCERVEGMKTNFTAAEVVESARELVEQGRTFVHHAVKRFMVILPAIFFKLGIAFTLLIIVSLVAVNNGFIGFLILVVGLSSVLSRLQQGGSAPYAHPVPLIAPQPVWGHRHFLDRSDRGYSRVSYSGGVERSDSAEYAAQVQRLNELLMQQRQQQAAAYGGAGVVYGGYGKKS